MNKLQRRGDMPQELWTRIYDNDKRPLLKRREFHNLTPEAKAEWNLFVDEAKRIIIENMELTEEQIEQLKSL